MMCKDEARVKLDFARHLEAVFASSGPGVCLQSGSGSNLGLASQ
jgi:hypothetical protein